MLADLWRWHSSELAEKCDDNNTAANDGCSSICEVEVGWSCTGGSIYPAPAKDTCTVICGDGLRVGSEACDDGNQVSLDGCATDCASVEDGFYCSGGSSSSADVCSRCAAECDTCNGPSSSDCKSCAGAHPFLSPPGSCLSDCTPAGKYANASHVCLDCDETCGTCSGPSSTDCLSCTHATFSFLSGSSCVGSCPNATFVDMQTGAAACLPCHASCAECSGSSSTSCVSCPSTGTKYFDDGQCVTACPTIGKFATVNMTCVECDASCLTCVDETPTGCTSCAENGELQEGTCVLNCPAGQFCESCAR